MQRYYKPIVEQNKLQKKLTINLSIQKRSLTFALAKPRVPWPSG